MEIKLYEQSIAAAYQIIYEDNINQFPICVTQICKKRRIALISYAKGKDVLEKLKIASVCNLTNAFALSANAGIVIFYNQALPSSCIRIAIAHELGHILQNHGKIYDEKPYMVPKIESTFSSVDDPLEHQADIFAIELLAPTCVLSTEEKSINKIQTLCKIDQKSATYKISEIEQILQETAKRKEIGEPALNSYPLARLIMERFTERKKQGKNNQ